MTGGSAWAQTAGGFTAGGGQIKLAPPPVGGSGNIAIGGVAGTGSDSAEGLIAIGDGSQSTNGGSVALGRGAQATGAGSVAIGGGSIADQAETVSVGSSGGERRIVNVADGVNANDAATVGQLRAMGGGSGGGSSAATTANTRAIEGNKRAIDGNKRAIEGNTQGIANVTAMASMPALPVGADSGFSAGVGGFNGKKAIALGFQHRLSANTTFKVAAAAGSNGKPTMGAGISYSWGGSSYNVASQTVAMQDVNAMQAQLRSTKAELAELMQRMAALEG